MLRKSKILKMISYLLIPFLILIISLSIFYEFGKNEYNKEIDTSTYFKTDTFLRMYMSELSGNVQRLIYHHDSFNSINDGEVEICFVDGNVFNYLNNNEYYLKDYYFLIQYKELAITNVELTSKTDNIESIKAFINNNTNKKAHIINGKVESDSEIFANKALQYYERFENTYYSINKDSYVVKQDDSSEILLSDNVRYDYKPYEYKYEITDNGVNIRPIEDYEMVENALEQANKEWYTTTINDFQIYSTFSEELVEIENRIYYKMLINDLKKYENQMFYALPIASVFCVIIFIYLIVAIGHTKGKDEIDFNDFDNIPIEILLGVGGFFVCLIIGIGLTSINRITGEYYKIANSLLLTGYFICYILCAAIGITTIKRIKARNLIKESLTGKIFCWCWKICKKTFKIFQKICKNIFNKIKELFTRIITTIREIIKNCPDVVKFTMILLIYAIVTILLLILGNFTGYLISLVIGGIILYGILEKINCYKKIEKHLKEMYEGNKTKKLDEKEVTKEFKDIVKYINDISRGFEKAIEEGIKSERLKTELITNVSHDIKTPLTSIINYVDLLKKTNIEDDKVKEYIEVLDSKSQRLKKLTEDLIEASKVSSGNVKLNIEKISIVELVKQSIGEFEDKFKAKELEIITEFYDEKVSINADNRYMYRIIENLFSNIYKYSQEKSRVYIDVKRIDNKAKIYIKNISKERLNISSEELMQRFVRGDKSRSTEGSGLGLSISKSLTEIQKGSFNIQIDGDLFKVELEFEII